MYELDRDFEAGDLHARIGIDTGEAVVAFGSGPLIGEALAGDVVNTASRLQSVAPPGGIVVGEATFRATRSRFDFEELEPVTVKGKTDPLAVWRARGALVAAGAEPDRVATAPFVGLFGTVVGIINAFKGIETTKATGLSAVAGGISEALVTTALGLLVAVPAVWAYNYFTNKVEAFDVEMDNSSMELVNYFITRRAGGKK
jgi:hypothetical protein